jgi:hypothetical protein
VLLGYLCGMRLWLVPELSCMRGRAGSIWEVGQSLQGTAGHSNTLLPPAACATTGISSGCTLQLRQIWPWLYGSVATTPICRLFGGFQACLGLFALCLCVVSLSCTGTCTVLCAGAATQCACSQHVHGAFLSGDSADGLTCCSIGRCLASSTRLAEPSVLTATAVGSWLTSCTDLLKLLLGGNRSARERGCFCAGSVEGWFMYLAGRWCCRTWDMMCLCQWLCMRADSAVL